MSENFLSDEQAAEMLEERSPDLARSIKHLIDIGETPVRINKFLTARFGQRLLTTVCNQAACHYACQQAEGE